MKKLYTDPSMDVSVFDAENIVTVSAGSPAGNGEGIDESKYAKIKVDFKDLKITF